MFDINNINYIFFTSFKIKWKSIYRKSYEFITYYLLPSSLVNWWIWRLSYRFFLKNYAIFLNELCKNFLYFIFKWVQPRGSFPGQLASTKHHHSLPINLTTLFQKIKFSQFCRVHLRSLAHSYNRLTKMPENVVFTQRLIFAHIYFVHKFVKSCNFTLRNKNKESRYNSQYYYNIHVIKFQNYPKNSKLYFKLSQEM